MSPFGLGGDALKFGVGSMFRVSFNLPKFHEPPLVSTIHNFHTFKT